MTVRSKKHPGMLLGKIGRRLQKNLKEKKKKKTEKLLLNLN